MDGTKIRVLCVDDHPMVRDGVCLAIEKEPDMELVGEASNGLEAILSYNELLPDVMLVDLQIPKLDGISVIERVRCSHPTARCIVLTTYDRPTQAARALRAGAAGYLLKTMVRKQMIDAIRTVHSGRRYIPKEIAAGVAEEVFQENLSPREIDVLENVSAGLSNQSIASKMSISENTVKSHLKSVTAKLNASDRTHAVLLAIRRGLLRLD